MPEQQIILMLLFALNMLFIWITVIISKWEGYRRIGFIFWGIFLICLPFTTQPRIDGIALWLVIGIAAALGGIAITVLAYREFRKTKTRLVTTGIYNVVRHPQYTGFALFYIGWSLVWGALYCLYLAPAIIFLHWLESFLEEKYILEKRFGNEYRKYKKKTGMLLPRIGGQTGKRNIVPVSIIVGIILLGGLVVGTGLRHTEPSSPTLEQQYGSISGQVVDDTGVPLDHVTVTVFGTDLSAETDEEGNYRIDGVPVAAPRYIVTAERQRFIEGQAGNVDIASGETTVVNFGLLKRTAQNRHHRAKLGIKLGYVMEIKPTAQKRIPAPDAVLAPSLYPEEVKPYLKPGMYIESDDPSIIELARQIRNGLLPWDRNKQTRVAKAVYDWMVKNIEYDLVGNFPGDVTCGEWQTINGGWGHNYNEWGYTAREVLVERRAISIEYERLCTALLRAAGIPARPAPLKAHPVTQWWVQLPDGSGYWANMETSTGHAIYEQNGDLWAKFPSRPESSIAFYAINEDAPIHLDWYTENPCAWIETYGASRVYEYTAEGKEAALSDIEIFARKGSIPRETGVTQKPPSALSPYYELYYRGFVIDLANIGEQEIVEVKFPLFIENEYRNLLMEMYWTDHYSWISGADVVTEQDDQTKEKLSYYKIVFDLLKPC